MTAIHEDSLTMDMAARHEEGMAMIARVRRELGPEMAELLFKSVAAAPAEAREWPPERMFQFFRCRLKFTLDELAGKAGLVQSQVSRIESGADCLLSTWTRAYAAMGLELLLIPASSVGLEELERLSESGRPEGHWRRQRTKPRRLWPIDK